MCKWCDWKNSPILCREVRLKYFSTLGEWSRNSFSWPGFEHATPCLWDRLATTTPTLRPDKCLNSAWLWVVKIHTLERKLTQFSPFFTGKKFENSQKSICTVQLILSPPIVRSGWQHVVIYEVINLFVFWSDSNWPVRVLICHFFDALCVDQSDSLWQCLLIWWFITLFHHCDSTTDLGEFVLEFVTH